MTGSHSLPACCRGRRYLCRVSIPVDRSDREREVCAEGDSRELEAESAVRSEIDLIPSQCFRTPHTRATAPAIVSRLCRRVRDLARRSPRCWRSRLPSAGEEITRDGAIESLTCVTMVLTMRFGQDSEEARSHQRERRYPKVVTCSFDFHWLFLYKQNIFARVPLLGGARSRSPTVSAR